MFFGVAGGGAGGGGGGGRGVRNLRIPCGLAKGWHKFIFFKGRA